MTPRPAEDAASRSAAINNRAADALADLAELVRGHAHLPALNYITCSSRTDPPEIDLWVDRPEEVTTWARALGADVIESEGADEATTFTTTKAILAEPETARVTVVNLAYHDQPPS